MKRLIGIVQFMTRIPIPIDTGFDEEFHKGIVYFPIVGLILGICYYVLALAGLFFFNEYITAILVLCGEAVLTGGLHLDGLGDTFDGLYSYRDKDRILEIMKDSRLGTNGLLAILFVILLKVGLIYEILVSRSLMLLVIMPAVARTMQVVACYKTKSPREKGMGNIFIGKVSGKMLIESYGFLVAVILGVLLATNMGRSNNMIFNFESIGRSFFTIGSNVMILTLMTRLFIRSVYKKIDGVTGDILGAICELSELVFILIAYLAYRFM